MSAAHQKVTASHLSRDAYLYVRQSSLRQVFEHGADSHQSSRRFSINVATDSHQSSHPILSMVATPERSDAITLLSAVLLSRFPLQRYHRRRPCCKVEGHGVRAARDPPRVGAARAHHAVAPPVPLLRRPGAE